MRTVAETFPMHGPGVLARAVTQGKRRRRVRRVRFAAATCVLTLAAVGGWVSLDHEADGQATAASDHTGLAPQPGGRVTGEQMVTTLTSLLPSGMKLTGIAGTGSQRSVNDPPLLTADPTVSARFTAPDGGATGITVLVTRPDPDTADARMANCPSGWFTSCERVAEPDGSNATLAKSVNPWGEEQRQTAWTVFLDRRDGVRVKIVAYGGGDRNEAGREVDPKLSFDQLTTIAASPRWNAAAVAAPPPEKRPLGILTKLVPTGAYEIGERRGGDGEHGQLQLTDLKGRSTLSVVASTQLAWVDTCHPLVPDCSVTTLPDGSQIMTTRQQPLHSPEGSMSWSVHVRRPDGLSLLVTASNNGFLSTTGGVDRFEPVLTTDQLQVIATSPLWNS
ncbi:hypothetical protein [Streptomyces sp. SID3343]|uniref:hypothetical protein n=1 Tax=Streptomyces sp. SID3343 TaxID=2690260 RepID=UPI00136E6458|nr:hypothetical protein [Streptomyces sp. SID3343]